MAFVTEPLETEGECFNLCSMKLKRFFLNQSSFSLNSHLGLSLVILVLILELVSLKLFNATWTSSEKFLPENLYRRFFVNKLFIVDVNFVFFREKSPKEGTLNAGGH